MLFHHSVSFTKHGFLQILLLINFTAFWTILSTYAGFPKQKDIKQIITFHLTSLAVLWMFYGKISRRHKAVITLGKVKFPEDNYLLKVKKYDNFKNEIPPQPNLLTFIV